MRYLGLDLGTKTLGLSVSDKTNTIASPYKTLHFKENEYTSVLQELKEKLEILKQYHAYIPEKSKDTAIHVHLEKTFLKDSKIYHEVLLKFLYSFQNEIYEYSSYQNGIRPNFYESCSPLKEEDMPTKEEGNLLGNMHKEKIKISDGIFVINVDGYIGESTQSEIALAKSLHKEVKYLEEI